MRPAPIVKVCGMCDPSNIDQVSRCGVTFMGFIFVPESPRYVGLLTPHELSRSLPLGITRVGVFKNSEVTQVVAMVSAYELDVIQLHGEEDSEYIHTLKTALQQQIPAEKKVWKSICVGDSIRSDMIREAAEADALLFDGMHPGSGVSFAWEMLRDYRGDLPFLLAGGIGPSNIDRARELWKAHHLCMGIDINSAVEELPGLKDIEKVRVCVERMRV